ncbi:hypothetical protein GM418_28870 [Maribellus comscasis]|uniref:Cellulase Ig-like domain-containing protein n=1 Tax=Maribellus comscasis TaxID=2681766 RepID=A0A6I6K1N9_9BACT|nr:hypothetical protein [Maribellus comscasis]QGY47539.1 hypothetical protein GM418_28870 [Maribellus comscasis]
MSNRNSISRRRFVKTGVLTAATVAGALSSCTVENQRWNKEEPFPVFKGNNYTNENGEAGLLFSQVGYEFSFPVRVILKLPEKNNLPESSVCKLIPFSKEKDYTTPCIYWGEKWGSHWWVAEFKEIDESGEWAVEVRNGGDVLWCDTGLKVEKDILWDSSIEWSSVDMLERRRHFTKVGAGWQDAGTLWVESPAQSAMIIALEELLEISPQRFEQSFIQRIYTQIMVGCDYLVMTQEKARELGFPPGAMSHDLLGHEKDILPQDVMKAVIALAKATQLLSDSFGEKKQKYEEVARLSFQWLLDKAKPMGDYGYARIQRGLAEDAKIPKDEYPTRDLLLMCRAVLEMRKFECPGAEELAFWYAKQVMDRQRSRENSESGFYGHFYEYKSMQHSEPSWTHGIVGSEFGTDMGGIYPNYLLPLIELLKDYPDHDDAKKWENTLRDFTYGYLIPACKQNPFYLVPQGIFGDEGAICFCGTFHGTNAIYGYTAALALELNKLFREPELKTIAYSNLQWLAGLNAGITSKNIRQGCVVFSTDIPEGIALPASMICGTGKRWAGTWFQTRGVICNGFSTGKQFKYDIKPEKKNDGPFSFTDEDWIPHSAGWLTGLMRL